MARLSDHFAAGRLSMAEFDERSGVVAGAVTRGDLAKVFVDLPEPVVAAPVPAAPVQRPGPPSGLVFPAIGVAVALAVVLFLATHLWFWFLLIPVIALARVGRSPNERERRRQARRGRRRGH